MIDLEWVNDYIDIKDEDPKKLAEKITEAGINIEKVITNHIDNLVVGEVVECIDHPNSDHLHICKVKINDKDITQIICGAPNVRRGLKVIVALPGAVLPGNFKIESSKIRGEISNGMLCALYELGLEEKNEVTYAKGIEELPSDAKVGIDPLKYLGLDNTSYELDIHKHRNNDCYYHIGFAYEIACILNKKVTLPEMDYKEETDDIKNHFKLEVNTTKCPYYLSKMITDVVIKESPEFIKKRLLRAGMRPINNVVDISNYVMLEYGQPLHFFDKDKLGNTIVVRDAKNEEVIITLDGKTRNLTQNDIVITDGTKPVGIAGVMGGYNTEITNNTKNILIESAIFDAVSIRYTSQRLNLKSEASIRYGKGLNYEYTMNALNRACHLLQKYANAKILSGIVSYDKIDKKDEIVTFTAEDINKMLGITISTSDMEKELNRLDFPYTLKEHTFTVTIPKRRLDIEPNVNDIAEEIGRLYGYHNLVSTLPRTTIRKGRYAKDVKYRKLISKRLRALGLNEVKTYTLTSPTMASTFKYENKENITIPNPMSVDKSVIRTTLIPSLLNTYTYNKARHIEDILIYEISKTYDINLLEDTKISILMKGNYLNNTWQNKYKVDFYVIKGIVENLLNYLGLNNRYTFISTENIPNMHPYQTAKIILNKKEIGIIGRIHPSTSKDDIFVAELSMNALITDIKPIKFKKASIYPSVTKDVAFIVDKNISCESIIKTIQTKGNRILTDIKVFDIYTNNIEENKKSIAFSLKFESMDKTLTEEVVNETFKNIIEAVINNHNAILRDN